MKQAFISWSGGKDCCQAAYKALHQGLKVRYLLNMVTQDRQRSCSHGVLAEWIRVQSEALGIPILQYPTTGENYESVFIEALQRLKDEDVTSGVFGDIDFEPHREWIEKVCAPAGISAVLPLWGGQQDKISRDFIQLGFKSVIIATRADLLGKEWLGKPFDTKFLRDLAQSHPQITPCGEAGEFHTLVIDGPIFKKRLEIRDALIVQRGDHWFWEIQKIDLVDKGHRRYY
jgi:diphthine-ammonia ligase